MTKESKRHLRKVAANARPDFVTPKFVTIGRWVQITGIGRTSTYQHIAAGNLRAVKSGSRTLIDVDHGLAFIRSLPLADIRLPNSRIRRVHRAARTPAKPSPEPVCL